MRIWRADYEPRHNLFINEVDRDTKLKRVLKIKTSYEESYGNFQAEPSQNY